MTTGEAARDTTLVERTAVRKPNLSPKIKVAAQDDDDPELRPESKQYWKENYL